MAYPTVVERFGSLSATGLAIETAFGTPVAATSWQPMTGNTMETNPGWFSPALMMGQRDLQVFNLYGEQQNVGTLDGALFPTNAVELLVAAIGTDAITGTGDPYTHTISQANTLASLTVEKNLGGFESLQFAGARVNKLSVKAPVGNEPVTVSADMIAQSALVLTTPTAVSITDEEPFVFAEASLTLATNARADVTNCEFSIENGLKPVYTYSGAHGPSYISPTSLKVSGTLDAVFSSLDDATYGDWTTMQAGTLGALSLTLAHSGTPVHSVQLSCPQVALTKVGQDVKFEDVILSTMAWEASLPLSGASQYTIQAVVNNAVATAY